MGQDVTTLCNLALAAVGTRSTISSINEQSNEARICQLHFVATRAQLLRAAHWAFARTYIKLPLFLARHGLPDSFPDQPPLIPGQIYDPYFEPPPPWNYAYVYPAEVAQVRYILPIVDTGTTSTPIFGTSTSTGYEQHYSAPMIKFEVATLSASSSVPGGAPFKEQLLIMTNQSKAIACCTVYIEDTFPYDMSFDNAFVAAFAAKIANSLTGDEKLVKGLNEMANRLIIEARVRDANEGLNANDVVPDWLRVRGVGQAIGTGSWVPEYGPLFGGVS